MVMADSSNPKANVDLLLDSSGTVQEIAKYLRSHDTPKESKHFYSSVIAHCLVIQGQLQRVRDVISDNHLLVERMLGRFEATIKTSVLKTQPFLPETKFPHLWALKKWWNELQGKAISVELGSLVQPVDIEGGCDESDNLIEFLEKWEDDINQTFPENTAPWARNCWSTSYGVLNALQSLPASPASQLGIARLIAPFKLASMFEMLSCQQPRQDLGLFRRRLASCSTRAPTLDQYTFQRPSTSNELDYVSMRLFDDETDNREHSAEARRAYNDWRGRYRDVYEKYIPTEPVERPVKIAVLDSGADLKHPLLTGGIHQVKGVYNWSDERFLKLIDDQHGHGTFITGLLMEYAPDAEIYIAKVSEGSTPSSPRKIARAIDFAVNYWKVDMISMSFGFPTREIDGYDELENAITRAYAAQVLMFACASNRGANVDRAYPARDENVICIHSTDAKGNRSPFSPTALDDTMNLATVGEAVESAMPRHLCKDPMGVESRSGTSYSTPIAVAIAAFVMQYVRLYIPEKAHRLKRQPRMKAVLRKIAEKTQPSRPRDDYHYIVLNRYSDNLFGKDQRLINATLRDLLSQ